MAVVRYRLATEADERAVFEVFRASIWSYLRDVGLVGPGEVQDVEAAWERQGSLMRHLARTAAHDWVAEDDGGRIVGMARSVERDGHAQLTHFFVDEAAQSGGVGRELLRRAFPLGWGRHRSILATQHPGALGLYLRFGVEAHATGLRLSKVPEPIDSQSDLVARRLGHDPEAAAVVESIEAQVLGYRRPTDLAFLIAERPLTLYERRGQPVGYAFGTRGGASGPAAVLDPFDLPSVLADQERVAHEDGIAEFEVLIASSAAYTLRWLLSRGYRIYPFYEMLLLDTPFISFDCYAMTQPAFIW